MSVLKRNGQKIIMEIVAQRVFNELYIYLDTLFLIVFSGLLIWKKRYLTLLFALGGGVLYMLVDYGIFHLLLGTRSIEGGNLFLVLLWMSMSYGMTNFALLWIWLSKDKRFIEWTTLIFIWWICCPQLAITFGGNFAVIKIQRTTGAYHGYMAIILGISYLFACLFNLKQEDKNHRFNILWLFVIGVLVQLSWEFTLLVGGIRSAQFETFGDKLMTLVVNSLLETNLGVVPIYCIYLFISSRFKENLKRQENKLTFLENLKLSNSATYR